MCVLETTVFSKSERENSLERALLRHPSRPWPPWPLQGGFWARAAAPLQRLLERNNLKPSDIDAVELLGGGSRVPRLQVCGDDSNARHLGLPRNSPADAWPYCQQGCVDASMPAAPPL
jgi:hypothetical protein